MRSTVVNFLRSQGAALVLAAALLGVIAWFNWPVTPDFPDEGMVGLPSEVRCKAGGYVKLTARLGKGVSDLTWVVPKGVFADSEEYGSKLALSPANDGVYSVYATGLYKGRIVTAAECRVIVGQGPQPPPVPPVPPNPPTPPDPPSPIPDAGLRVLIVYESADLSKLPPAQAAILTSRTVRDYLNAKCVVEPDGKTRGYRFWDKDAQGIENDLPVWANAFKRPRQSVPWLIVSNGKSGFEGPLPATVDEFLAAVKKQEGK